MRLYRNNRHIHRITHHFWMIRSNYLYYKRRNIAICIVIINIKTFLTATNYSRQLNMTGDKNDIVYNGTLFLRSVDC